jgi:hypothetical protein
MQLPTWALDVLEDGGFIRAVGVSLAVGAATVWIDRDRPHGRGLTALAVVAAGILAGSLLPGVALLVVAAGGVAHLRSPRPPVASWDQVLLALAAAGAVYACLPDTELALAVLGAVTVAGAVALVRQVPWRAAAAGTTAALVAASLLDGSPRSSALVGGLGIAACLGVVSATDRHGLRRKAGVVVIATGAMVVCSRVAGRGPDTIRPVVVTAACVALVVAAVLLAARSAGRPNQGVAPEPGDG